MACGYALEAGWVAEANPANSQVRGIIPEAEGPPVYDGNFSKGCHQWPFGSQFGFRWGLVELNAIKLDQRYRLNYR